jgi:hypothetical protein
MFTRCRVLRVLVHARERILIRFSSHSGLSVVALLVAVLLMPSSAWANMSKNCPVEPSRTTIVSGETYFGSNCVLSTASDQDVFNFSASAGDTWRIIAGSPNVVNPNNICLTLNDPNGKTVGSGCSLTNVAHSAGIISTLTVGGTYTVIVTETSTAVIDYGVSLERLSPAPVDGTALVLGNTITSEVNPPSAQDAYTFFGTATGTYQVSATMTSGSNPENLCFAVYQPGGKAVTSACTETNFSFTAQAKFTPTVNGTHVVVVFAADNTYTLNYNFSVTCVSAPSTCGSPPPPPCTLKDMLSYNATSGTLTMNFTLGTPVAVTWNAWLTSQNTMQNLWSVSQPITVPSVPVTKTQALAKSGKVGVLSTFTTPTAGITCSSWVQVNTGTP